MALSHKKDCLRLYKATQSLGDVHESPTIWFFHMSMTTSRQAGRLSSWRSYRWWNRTQDLAHHMTIFFFLIGWLNELHNFGCIAGLITLPRKHTTPEARHDYYEPSSHHKAALLPRLLILWTCSVVKRHSKRTEIGYSRLFTISGFISYNWVQSWPCGMVYFCWETSIFRDRR